MNTPKAESGLLRSSLPHAAMLSYPSTGLSWQSWACICCTSHSFDTWPEALFLYSQDSHTGPPQTDLSRIRRRSFCTAFSSDPESTYFSNSLCQSL